MDVRPLHPHAALLLRSSGGKKYVAVSDLHIGIEAELVSKGITLRSSLVNDMATELKDLAGSVGADGIILLGDIKHTVGTISKQEWDDIPTFLKMLSSQLEVHLVPGNHDGNIRHLIPPSVNVISSKGMTLDDTLLVHGHSMPSDVRAHVNRIVMGHLHPIFFKRGSVVSGKRVWIYIRAKKDALFSQRGAVDIVVVPSFNPHLHAMGPKSYHKSISPIMTRVMEHKGAVEKCVIATLDGSIVGDAEVLKQIL